MSRPSLPAAMSLDAFQASLVDMPEDEAWELVDMPEDEAWELVDGRAHLSRIGRTAEHILVIQNVAYAIRTQLRALPAPFMIFVQSFYLMNPSIRSAILPHVMVRGGHLPPGATSCDDPLAIVEVLNHRDFQRDSDRWDLCRRLPSLQHYALVDHKAAVVAIHDRAADAWYERRRIEGLDATLDLAALDVSIPLAEIYRDVLSA